MTGILDFEFFERKIEYFIFLVDTISSRNYICRKKINFVTNYHVSEITLKIYF